MAKLEFPEVIDLINRSGTATISAEPSAVADGRAKLHAGRYHFHVAEYPFQLLYLLSGIRKDDLVAAARAVPTRSDLHVVYPPSVGDKLPNVRQAIDEACGDRVTVRICQPIGGYLRSFMKDELDQYLNTVRGRSPRHYIDPRVEVPSGIPRKHPNPLLTQLRDDADAGFRGKVGVLLADPGQGKTYMCQRLIADLADAHGGFVPVLIDSSQWERLADADLANLERTIANSFRHYEAPIRWVDGNEEAFLTVSLKPIYSGWRRAPPTGRASVPPRRHTGSPGPSSCPRSTSSARPVPHTPTERPCSASCSAVGRRPGCISAAR